MQKNFFKCICWHFLNTGARSHFSISLFDFLFDRLYCLFHYHCQEEFSLVALNIFYFVVTVLFLWILVLSVFVLCIFFAELPIAVPACLRFVCACLLPRVLTTDDRHWKSLKNLRVCVKESTQEKSVRGSNNNRKIFPYIFVVLLNYVQSIIDSVANRTRFTFESGFFFHEPGYFFVWKTLKVSSHVDFR